VDYKLTVDGIRGDMTVLSLQPNNLPILIQVQPKVRFGLLILQELKTSTREIVK
jgi:hypothetical protein